MMIWYYALLWIGLVILAILNGLFREKVIRRTAGELTAHQISTFSLIGLSALFTWLFSLILPLGSTGESFAIGGMWVGMTIAFEFIFGHYVVKKPWRVLFADYHLLRGRIWILVLLWTFVAPWVFFSL